MRNFAVPSALVILAISLIGGCSSKGDEAPTPIPSPPEPSSVTESSSAPSPPPWPKQVTVATNIWAIKWVVDSIAGDLVQTTVFGSEAHKAPDQRELELVAHVDLVVYMGNLSQPVQEAITRAQKDTGPSRAVVDIAQEFKDLPLIEPPVGLDRGDLVDNKDPHVWLDAGERMKRIGGRVEGVVRGILDSFNWPVPDKDRYRKLLADGFDKLHKSMDQLHRQLTNGLNPCRSQTIVVEHPAFGYFVKEFGLDQLAVTTYTTGNLTPAQQQEQLRRVDTLWNAPNMRRVIFLDQAQR